MQRRTASGYRTGVSNIRIVVVALAIAMLVAAAPHAPSAVRARTVTPKLAATLEIGGTSGETLLGDVDGDGRPDVVTLRGGRVVVISTDGRTIFDRFLGATSLVSVADIDLNGHDDVITLNGPARTIAAVDPFAQSVRWTYTFSEAVSLDPAYVRVADLSSARPGLETVAFPDHSHTLGDAKGVFIDATGVVFARPIVRSVNGNQLNFPQLAIANVDASGDPEVVVVGRPKLLVYRSDGTLASELAFQAGDVEGRHYGTLQLANVDGDADLEAIVISDRVAQVTADKSPAIVVFDLAPSVREIWRTVLPSGHLLESIPNGVADFDGDGAADFAVNHFDGATQSIDVFRGGGDASRPGQPQLLTRLEGVFAWDVWARSAEATVFFGSVDRLAQPSMSYRSRLVLVDVRRTPSGGVQLVRRDAPVTARYATRPLRALGRDVPESSLSADRSGVVATLLPKGPAYVTYTRTADGDPQIQFRLFGASPSVIDRGTRTGTVRAITATGYALVAESAGDETTDSLHFYRLDQAGDPSATVSSFRAGGFDAQAPAVADLDGDGDAELIIRTAGKRIVAFGRARPDGPYLERWSASSSTRPVVDAAASPSGHARIFVVAASQHDRATLVALDGNGKPLWETRFRDLPASAKPEIVVGEFTGAPPRDVWLSAPRSKSWVVDGANGRIVWESPAIFSYSNRAAVVDANSDGIDDIVAVGNFTYGVYSGTAGKPIVGPVDVRKMGGDLFATPMLAGDGTLALVSSSKLAKAKVGGRPDWQVDRVVGRTSSSLLPGLARDASRQVFALGGNFGASDRFVAYDYDDGRVAFTTDHVPMTDVVTADTDGDGEDEFIFGTTDGRVVALAAQTGVEIWAIDVGAFASTPSVERLNAGALSLLVPLADGTIRIYSLSP